MGDFVASQGNNLTKAHSRPKAQKFC